MITKFDSARDRHLGTGAHEDRNPFSLIARTERNDGISFVDFDFDFEGAVTLADRPSA